MLVIGVVAIGIVVGIITHLILGEDGYSWFGEIILAIAGATIFGFLMGIAVGARFAGVDFLFTGGGEVNYGAITQIVVAAIVGALVADGLALLFTFRATGRGFGQAAR